LGQQVLPKFLFDAPQRDAYIVETLRHAGLSAARPKGHVFQLLRQCFQIDSRQGSNHGLGNRVVPQFLVVVSYRSIVNVFPGSRICPKQFLPKPLSLLLGSFFA
jgi:hypothetical protein